MIKKIASVILLILGLIMLYLGYKIGGLPPAVTGVGFLVISYIFYREAD